MLAQWVPLHAVSCSNLIETGVGAESREIPLRVTQTCLFAGAAPRARMVLSFSLVLSSTPLLSAIRNARCRSRAVGRRLLLNGVRPAWLTIAFVHPHIHGHLSPSKEEHAIAFRIVDCDPRYDRVLSCGSPGIHRQSSR